MAACHRAWLGGVPMPYLAPHFHYDMFMSYAHVMSPASTIRRCDVGRKP
jgi:hypothetical protein